MNCSEFAALVTVMLALNGAFLWAVKWLFNRHSELMTKKVEAIRVSVADQMEKHDQLKADMSSLKECLPREYVRREDWIMSFSRIEQKIDAIWQYIHTRGE